MTGKVKEHKTQMVSTSQASDEAVQHDDSHDEPVVSFVESNVSLYQYGGFALHSLPQKYKKDSHEWFSFDPDIKTANY